MTNTAATEEHAKLSPSAAHRWLVCPGSLQLSEGMESASSAAAERGTLQHEALEALIRAYGSPVGGPRQAQLEKAWAVLDMGEKENVARVLAWVEPYLREPHRYVVQAERKVSPAPFFPHTDESILNGTADITVYDVQTKTLTVVDAKFGHHEVPAEDNPQLALYGLGVLAEKTPGSVKNVGLLIAQPKTNPMVRPWWLTENALLSWAERNRPAVAVAALALQPGAAPAALKAGEHCHFCPAKAVCTERQKETIKAAQEDFKMFSEDPRKLSQETLAELLDKADTIRSGLDAIEKHVFRQLQLGVKWPGWKLVTGEKRRVWVDPEKAQGMLEVMGVNPFEAPKLISPAQAEKQLGDEIVDAFAEKPKGAPQLAREDDRRKAVASDFE